MIRERGTRVIIELLVNIMAIIPLKVIEDIHLSLSPFPLLSSSQVSAPTLLLRDSSFGGLARALLIRLLDGDSWGLGWGGGSEASLAEGWCWGEVSLAGGWCWGEEEVLTESSGGGEGDVVPEILLMSFSWSSNFLFASWKNYHHKEESWQVLTNMSSIAPIVKLWVRPQVLFSSQLSLHSLPQVARGWCGNLFYCSVLFAVCLIVPPPGHLRQFSHSHARLDSALPPHPQILSH